MNTPGASPRSRISILSLVGICLALAESMAYAAVIPNARLNANLQAYGSPAAGVGNLIDGKFGNGSWNSSSGAWVAYKLAKSPGKVVLAWNNPSYAWSDYVTNASKCAQGSALSYPTDYEILTSSNSTNGSDGTWTSRLKISGNKVSSRMHVVATGSDNWVKMTVSTGSGNLDELGIFDGSSSTDDTWIFIGTSISSNTFKGTPPATDFVNLVSTGTKGANYPAVVKAGIPCILSTDVSTNIKRYLEFGGSSKFWAIEMGTNDAWGGGTGNLQSFKTALQLVVDSAKGRGIKVAIARPLATNSGNAGWQMNQAFLTAVDDLTRTNGLAAGPDLYAWFLAHPSELNDDGVHPNATGAASIQRLWAEAMLKSVYSGSSSIGDDKNRHSRDAIRMRYLASGIEIDIDGAIGPMRLVSTTGEVRDIGKDGRGFVPREWCKGGIRYLQIGRSARAILLAHPGKGN